MSWGTELWDKYEDLCGHTTAGVDFLEKSVADYIKERGKVEKEYAKSLRALVKKFAPKSDKHASDKNNDNKAESGPASLSVRQALAEDEFSYLTAYKEMLAEVGYQAGQHEVLAESFSKDVYKHLHDEAKKLKESRRKNIKESDKLVNELNSAFKSMHSSKEKFRKAFDDHERAQQAFSKANNDGSVSRNELEKLRLLASNKGSTCESVKHTFADTLVKTNAFRQRYYYDSLPGVLDELQELDRRRIELIRHGILSCIAKEREVMPIISKCHDSIQNAMDSIDPEKDTAIVIERFKSGDVPPGDFNFEDMHDPQALLSQEPLASTGPTNLNLYPRKKELERQIQALEAELSKSSKELKSLNQMMATYQNQPKFGNSKQFKGEIQGLHAHIGEIEAALTSFKAELVGVDEKLSTLRHRSPHVTRGLSIAGNGNAPQSLRRGGSTGSSKSSSLSIASSSKIYDVVNPDYDEIPPPPPASTGSTGSSSASDHADHVHHHHQTGSDTMSSMSSPSVTSASSSEASMKRAIALYTYNNANTMEESNIPMEEGEEFLIVDDDCDGWTRVRRAIPSQNPNVGDEGFVPTTWIRMVE